MNKSILLQSLVVLLLFVNIFRLDFANVLSIKDNSLQYINIVLAIVLLIALLLKESPRPEKGKKKSNQKAFGKRKEL